MNIRMTLRVPEYLRDWVRERGKNKSRSINGEIVEILKEMKTKEDKLSHTIDEH